MVIYKRNMNYYDSNASEYAARSYQIDLDSLLEPFCQVVPASGRILDLGSGAGRDSLAMTSKGFNVVSLDRSMGLLLQHRQRGGKALVCGDFVRLPFRSAFFDAIWACASLLHIPKAMLSGALTEIGRVLRPHGVFFLSVKSGKGELIDADGRFWSFYQEGELLHSLQQTNFRLVKQWRTKDRAGRTDFDWINILSINQSITSSNIRSD